MTSFETGYRLLRPFLLPLYGHVRRELVRTVRTRPNALVLDVGGRQSPYTIGMPARIVISDLPRTSETQRALDLGIDNALADRIRRRRSNVLSLVYDDMTETKLPARSFDIVLAVEVLEHVEDDRAFLFNVSRLLELNGVFLMTTPNGDWVPLRNPDHKRHYRGDELRALLNAYFWDVHVWHAIRDTRIRKWGLRSWSVKHPLRTVQSMIGNFINGVQSSGSTHSSRGTRHLMAVAGRPRLKSSEHQDTESE